MAIIEVGLADTTGTLDKALVEAAAAALNIQVMRDLGPVWTVSATVRHLTDPKNIPAGVWPVYLVDHLPPGEGGVHLDNSNQPYSLVVASTGSADWTIDASHETIEMLVDPSGNRMQTSQSIGITDAGVEDTAGEFDYLVEACDPCEANQFAYAIQGIGVSDFITPNFYDPAITPGTSYSFCGHVTRPRQILPGGYISFTNPASNEMQQILFLGAKPEPRNLGPTSGACLRGFVDARTSALVERARKPNLALTSWCREHQERHHNLANQRGRNLLASIERKYLDAGTKAIRSMPTGMPTEAVAAPGVTNVLMIHGVNTNEDAAPNPYSAWVAAISSGMAGAGYLGSTYDPLPESGLRYNSIFANSTLDPATYAEAAAELIASAAWHSIFSAESPGAGQPGPGFMDAIRWTAGMVAQWVVEAPVQSQCRDLICQAVAQINPDVVFAHSLGSLLLFDLLTNDPRGKSVLSGKTLVTFGSQIGNPFISAKMWGGKIPMPPVAKWYNLYNPHDPVFVAPIVVDDPNFFQFTMNPPFGSWLLDLSGHEVTAAGPGQHPGYLDNSTTTADLYPALVGSFGGSTSALIGRNIALVKALQGLETGKRRKTNR